MISPCTTRRTALTRTGALVVAFGLAVAPTAAAFAQDPGGTTVRALIAGDGSVTSVESLGGGQAPAAGDLPVTVAISQNASGEATTTNYTVTNTTSATEAVSYLDAAGKTATVQQDVALPLVAQLAVRLPSSRTGVLAPGARITTLSDGSSELVWSMILFGPIGAPVSDVSFTAAGKGEPLARLAVVAVQPNATPGLSATAQSANAIVNGNGILSTVANGANDGLLKLADGVGKLLAGLDKLEAGAVKLNEGLADGADGAAQLAAGSATAKAGSDELSTGLRALAAGNGALAAGLRSTTGEPDLTGGADLVADNLAIIADGLQDLDAGVSAILDENNGLPPALRAGAQQLLDGINQAIAAAIGDPATDKTLINGLYKLQLGLDNPTLIGGKPGVKQGLERVDGGLAQFQAGLRRVLTGLDSTTQTAATPFGGAKQTLGTVQDLLGCSRSATPSPCASVTPTVTIGGVPSNIIVQQALVGLVGGLGTADGNPAVQNGTVIDGLTDILLGIGASNNDPRTNNGTARDGLADLVAGVGATPADGTLQTSVPPTLLGGLYLLRLGLDNPALLEGKPGLKQGLALGIKDGLDQYVAGVIAGIRANVVGDADTAGTLKFGTVALSEGAGLLADGAGTLADKLDDAADGADLLSVGSRKAATGGGSLAAGLGKIAAGQQKVADGLPAAVDGSGQIADGLGKVIDGETSVGKGVGDVRTKAVDVLRSQFAQGTTLARQQLAGLDAAAAKITSTPGAATTTYVLTQSEGDITATQAGSESGSSTGRNIGLAAGGVLLLLGGIAGGFVSGRRAGA